MHHFEESVKSSVVRRARILAFGMPAAFAQSSDGSCYDRVSPLMFRNK